jgi:hypothetical protein
LVTLLSVLLITPSGILPAQDNSPDSPEQASEIREDAVGMPQEENAVTIDDTSNVFNEPVITAEEESLIQKLSLPERLVIAAAIVILMIIFIWFLWYLFKRFKDKLTEYGDKHFKSLTIKKYRIMDTKQILGLFFSLLKLAKYVVTVFMLIITIPIVFSLFERTQNLASVLFGYILTPLKNIGLGIIHYIPNLFTIVIILIINKYVIQTIKFLATRIEKGKLVINGF